MFVWFIDVEHWKPINCYNLAYLPKSTAAPIPSPTNLLARVKLSWQIEGLARDTDISANPTPKVRFNCQLQISWGFRAVNRLKRSVPQQDKEFIEAQHNKLPWQWKFETYWEEWQMLIKWVLDWMITATALIWRTGLTNRYGRRSNRPHLGSSTNLTCFTFYIAFPLDWRLNPNWIAFELDSHLD